MSKDMAAALREMAGMECFAIGYRCILERAANECERMEQRVESAKAWGVAKTTQKFVGEITSLRALNDELCKALRTLVAYCVGQMTDGLPHSPTLPSAVDAARAVLARAGEQS